jgi:hypothetical protein
MRHMPLRDTGIRNGKFPSSMPCQLALPPWGSRTFEIDTEISIKLLVLTPRQFLSRHAWRNRRPDVRCQELSHVPFASTSLQKVNSFATLQQCLSNGLGLRFARTSGNFDSQCV